MSMPDDLYFLKELMMPLPCLGKMYRSFMLYDIISEYDVHYWQKSWGAYKYALYSCYCLTDLLFENVVILE